METHTHAHVIAQHSYIVSLQSAHDTNCTDVCTCVHACAYYVHRYMITHIHTRVHTNTHMCVQNFMWCAVV